MDTHAPRLTGRLGRPALSVLGAVLVFFVVSGAPVWEHGRHSQHRTSVAGAGAVLRALTSDAPARTAEALVPVDFRRVMGYRPVVAREQGRDVLERRTGSCSSPFGGTRYDFSAACRQHDLGYDLLRYADRTGHPLGSWARAAVDGAFGRHLHERCHSAACDAAADVYAGAVTVNSVRQLYRVPVVEAATSWLVAAAAGLVVLALGWSRRARQLFRRASRAARDRTSAPVVAAATGLALTLVPSILPRPLVVQVLVSALVMIQLAVVAMAANRLLRGTVGTVLRRGPRWATPPRVRAALALASLAAVGLGVVLGQVRGSALLAGLGEAAPSPFATTAAAVLASAVVLALAGVHRAGRWLARTARRSRRLRVALAVPALAIAGSLVTGGPAAAQEPLTSGIGVKGRQFLSQTPTATQLRRVTGRPAQQPIRRYVGLSRLDPEQQAVRAVGQLEDAGGFDRAAVLLVVPTGSGWVDPAAVESVELLYGGDVATVAVQYDDVPSWQAYLRGTGRGQRSASAVLHALRRHIDARPAGRRPRLLLFGESLGALSGLHAQVGEADGAVWVGVPATARARAEQAARWTSSQQVLLHPDDPVAAWSPALALHDTATWPGLWLPGVSFWQGVADLASAYWTPEGHGHRYSRELVDAWRAAVHPATPGTPAPDRLAAVRDAVGAGAPLAAAVTGLSPSGLAGPGEQAMGG